jgi:hypothetical protein
MRLDAFALFWNPVARFQKVMLRTMLKALAYSGIEGDTLLREKPAKYL